MSEFSELLYAYRCSPEENRADKGCTVDAFYRDRSRIIFSSSFRRMMHKAQVFSLETNSFVRNRLTHSLEVADIGRSLARKVGQKLFADGKIALEEIELIETIVESACLIHDIGNPPFGHFGEEAVKKWFQTDGISATQEHVPAFSPAAFYDFSQFDGNPQGFRIVTKLHNETGEHGLNLTAATLLSSIKYPVVGVVDKSAKFGKKLGVFDSEKRVYENICLKTGHTPGRRYFLAYLMELADDICYCTSDIADSIEKCVVSSRDFQDDFRETCMKAGVDCRIVPSAVAISHFGIQVSKVIARTIINEASDEFVRGISSFVSGDADPLAGRTETGRVLEFLKGFARRYIYTSPEAQRIEIAGNTIVKGLLMHFSCLLKIKKADFLYFIEARAMRKDSGLDLEWRVFNQLSPRMIKCYQHHLKSCDSLLEEKVLRTRLILDFIAGLTDRSALSFYQNFMGISF